MEKTESSRVFEMLVTGPVSVEEIATFKENTTRETNDYWMFIPDDADHLLDSITKEFGFSAEKWLYDYGCYAIKSEDKIPWALVAFSEEYDIAEHVIDVRGDSGDFGYSFYSSRTVDASDISNHRVSFLNILKKSNLSTAAKKSRFFNYIWETLKEREESQRWMCIFTSQLDI